MVLGIQKMVFTVRIMLNNIDIYIERLLDIRNMENLTDEPNIKGWISSMIAHFYHLECCMMMNIKLNVDSERFFKAKYSVNRYLRDWGLDEIADIYNRVRVLSKEYLNSNEGFED